MYNTLNIEIEDKIALVTINRPQSLNSLNKEVFDDLDAAFDDFGLNSDVRCVIITGSGEKAFVAGADIKEFTDLDKENAGILSEKGHRIFDKIENFQKPVIAAINGFALGGGLELALSCHIRYASENAKLGLPEVTLGLIPGYGGTQRLPKIVGKGIANEMIFSAKMISAQKAFSIGLVNEVIAISELIQSTKDLASQIIKNSPDAIAKAITAVNEYDKISGKSLEIKSFGELFGTENMIEGVSAFLEKRKAEFK